MTKREVLDAAANGEGCLGRSQDDEPVFVLCARDVLAIGAVQDWIRQAAHAGVNDAKIAGAMRDARQMNVWRKTHGGGRVPD